LGFVDLFLHGHAPSKNSITREQLRKAVAKPSRRTELNWDAETEAKLFPQPDILVCDAKDDHLLRRLAAAGAFPHKIFDFAWTPF